VVRCRGTCALGKFHLRQKPEVYSSITTTFCELCAKLLTIQEQHGLWHQDLCDCLWVGEGLVEQGVATICSVHDFTSTHPGALSLPSC
jgi:hypothetical protein